LIGPTIRGGLRLDEAWSLMGSLQYLYATGAAGAKGLRFAGTIEPTWHATSHLSLAAGIGFGGIVEQGSSRPGPKSSPSIHRTPSPTPASRCRPATAWAWRACCAPVAVRDGAALVDRTGTAARRSVDSLRGRHRHP